MESLRESRFMRAVFAALVFSALFRLARKLLGELGAEPRLGVVVAALLGAIAGFFVWHMYRVYER